MTAHLCVADSFSFLTNLLNYATSNLPDLILTPGLGVHRSLLASLSPLLSSILKTTVSDWPLLVLPHVETSTLERMVQLVYSGSCSVTYSEMPNLVQLLEDLDLTVVLQSLSFGSKVKQVEKRTSRTNEELVDINVNNKDGLSVGVVLEECEVCRKKFKAGEELGLHFVKQHCFKQDSSMFENGKVQCIRCEKMFNDKDVIKLLEHIGHDHGELLENGRLEKDNNCEVVEDNENISPFKERDNVNRNISEVSAVRASGHDVEIEENANNDETAVVMESSVANEESTPPNAGFELDVIVVETEVNNTGNTVINKDSFAAKEASGVNSCDIIIDDNNSAEYQHGIVRHVIQLLSDEEESGRAMKDNTSSNNTSSNEENISPNKGSVDDGAAAVSGESLVEIEESAVVTSNVTGYAANNNDSIVAMHDICTVSMEENTVASENNTHAHLEISVKNVVKDICVAVDDNNNDEVQHNLKDTVRTPLNNDEASKDESDLDVEYNTDSNNTECDDDTDEDEIFPFLGQSFFCEICQKITPTQQEFVVHIRSLHQNMFNEAESRSKSDLDKILYYLKKMRKFACLKPRSDGKMSLESNPPNSRNTMKLRPKLVKKSIQDVGKTQVTPWKYIKLGENLYTGTADVRKEDFLEYIEPEQCDCAKEDNPACGSRCINWSTSTECDPRVCVNGERCMNMIIQKKQYVPGLERFMTKDKGWGVRVRQRVPEGTFIMEYIGQVCSSKEYERRLVIKYKEDDHRYCLALNSKTVIDAHRAGSECRFVNHSCDPNCRMDKWTVAGLPRLALFSLRDISPGEEICYDYMFSLFNTVKGVACKCGKWSCRGAQVIDIDSEDEEPAQNPAAGDIIIIDSDEEDSPQTQLATLDVSSLENSVRLTRARKKMGAAVIVNVMNDVPAITDLEKLNIGDDVCESLPVVILQGKLIVLGGDS